MSPELKHQWWLFFRLIPRAWGEERMRYLEDVGLGYWYFLAATAQVAMFMTGVFLPAKWVSDRHPHLAHTNDVLLMTAIFLLMAIVHAIASLICAWITLPWKRRRALSE